MNRQILSSSIKTVLVGAACAGVGSFWDVPLLQTFIAAICAQFVLFFIYNSIIEYLHKSNLEQQFTERERIYSEQGVDVTCASCGSHSFIPIKMDGDNEFECEVCGVANSVYINITTAQKTEPLDRKMLSVDAYIADKVKKTTAQKKVDDTE